MASLSASESVAVGSSAAPATKGDVKTDATGVADQIPRASLALLMVGQLVVALPLMSYISVWVAGVCLLCGYWRTQVHRGRWAFPSASVKALLVGGSILGLAYSGYATFSLEAAASLLVLAFALKLVEMKNRRDAYLVIFLSYFLIATAFLFDQTMTIAAYEFVAAIVVTAAMVGMNQLQSRVRPLTSLRVAASLILQAIPLMLVLFLLFPRVAPLWSIPLPSAASTGLSDKLTPGDVAQLSQSDELAFRAVFSGKVPRAQDLYWRGLVYSEFSRGTWAIAEPLPPLPIDLGASQAGNQIYDYEVFMEPTQSSWLYALDTPITYPGNSSLLADYRLESDGPVLAVRRYRVQSDANLVMDGGGLSPDILARETKLPPLDNPRIREYAQRLLAEAGSPRGMVREMMSQIREEPFAYTLSPPTLSRTNSIDQFWFDERRGFCTHYAGAMVFALRAVGIPARMVGGYQGGRVNPVSGHVEVRQFLAHAWVEVWMQDVGWQRFDPTGAVAPERVESGLEAALSAEDRAALLFLSSARMGGEGGLTQLLEFVDSLEHRWNLWVVGYDGVTQASVLKDLLGEVTPARIGIALAIGGGVSLALVSIALFWRRRPAQRHKVERAFANFCTGMAKRGYTRAPHETPVTYVRRLAQLAQWPSEELEARLQRQLYDPELLHTESSEHRHDGRKLRQDLRKLRFKLAFGTPAQAS